MIALLSLLPARTIALVVLVIVAAGSAWGALALHDRAVRAHLVAAQTAAQAEADAAQHQRVVAALGRAIEDQRAAAEADARIKEAIAHEPDTNACAGSAAVRAAIDGMRGPADGATGAHPAGAAIVPGRAAAAPAGKRRGPGIVVR